jgi:hypothetical protein
VGQRPARAGAQLGQVVDHGVATAGAVDGDQQVVAPFGGDGGDRGVDDRDVVGGGVVG